MNALVGFASAAVVFVPAAGVMVCVLGCDAASQAYSSTHACGTTMTGEFACRSSSVSVLPHARPCWWPTTIN